LPTARKAPNRIFSVPSGGQTLTLPAFFPSVSSLKADLPPLDYVRVLTELAYPLFLVSAFDIHEAMPSDRTRMLDLVAGAIAQGSIVLLDSGRYESSWTRSVAWSAVALAGVLREATCSLAFCYDEYPDKQSVQDRVGAIEQAVLREQIVFPHGTVIPVIHGLPEELPELALQVADRTRPVMIALPERELGDGLRARARTVRAVRAALASTGIYVPLHLLGTGSPISILVFAAAGADSFDGLEWCNTAIDHTDAMQRHFHQAELLSEGSHRLPLADASYIETTLANNLIFYSGWQQRLRMALMEGSVREFASHYMPGRLLEDLMRP
jgi:hypothetical protein